MNDHANHRPALAILAIAILAACLLPSAAHALTLTPTRFEVRGDPGETLTERLTLINEDDATETFYSSYANFEAQGESGSPAFVEPKDDLGTWITTDSAVTLAPRQQKEVDFTVSIPKNAEPGGHFAVVFWGTSPAGATGVAIGAKTGVLVLLSVNGDVKEEAGLLNFNTVNNKFFYNTLPVDFEYRFRNDGGDRVKPVGTVTLRDTLYIRANRLDANPSEGNVLPASTRKIIVTWQKYDRPLDYVAPSGFFRRFWSNVTYEWKNFAVGLYSAHLNVAYGADNVHVKKTAWFFVFPWQLVIVMVAVLFIVLWGGRKLIKRYNRYIIEKARAGMMPHSPSHG